MKTLLLLFALVIVIGVNAQTGPGGVGTTDGSSSLKIWYNTTNGVHTTGALIDAIDNSAGISDLNISETVSNRPTLNTNAVNGIDEISFSGSEMLRTGSNKLTTSNFITDQASSFVVNRADNTTQRSCVYTTDPLVGNTRFSSHIPWDGTVYYDIGVCCTSSSRIQVGGLSGLNNYSYWSYDANPSTGKQLYRNGSLLQSRSNTSTYNSHSSQRFNIGGNTSGTGGFVGDVTEIIIFNQKINTVQRIIIENYLSAKFNITAATNDKYVGDDAAKGNYDKNIIGIGTESSGSHTKSSDNKGLIIEQNSGFDNGDYLFAGNAVETNSTNYTDISGTGAVIKARWERIWYFDVTDGATGSAMHVDITFDLSDGGFSGTAGVVSNYKLLYRSGTTGAWTDAGTATGVSGDQIIFSNNSLSHGDGYYTIGTLDYDNATLPIELTSFSAKKTKEIVNLNWQTATETNNNYFTVERSLNAKDWEAIAQVKGAGNSNELLNYSAMDNKPIKGINYYRLKQTDFDGKYSYSSIRKIQLASNSAIRIYPNPTQNTISIEGVDATIQDIRIYNVIGAEVSQAIPRVQKQGDKLVLDLSSLPMGVYFIKLEGQLFKVFKQ